MVLRTTVGLLLLGGLIDTWWQVALTGLVLVIISIGQSRLAHTRFVAWMDRFPLILRLGGAGLLSLFLLNQLASYTLRPFRQDDFLLPLLTILVALTLITFASTSSDSSRRNEPSRWVNKTTGFLALTGTLLTMWSRPVAADNCAALSDCFGTSRSLMLGLGLLLVIAGIALIATAPVSAPLLLAGGGGFMIGASAAIPAAALVTTGSVIVGTETGYMIRDNRTTSLPDTSIAVAEARPVAGDWSDGPKPPPPLDAEVDDIIDHAWDKHVVEQAEFPAVEETVENATDWGYREDGGTYWYDELTDTVVIRNPPGGGGTIYRPGSED